MIYLLLVIFFSALGQFMLKLSTRPGSAKLEVLSVLFFIFAAIMSIFSVSSIGFYSTYMSTALSYVVTTALGRFTLGEKVGSKRLTGLVLIGSGVLAFSVSN